MAIAIDPKQIVLNDELLLSQVLAQEAVIRLLAEKEIFTKAEFLEMANAVNFDIAKKVQPGERGGRA
jgi:hypothetical protein